MKFIIQRIDLTDASGVAQWSAACDPRPCGEAHGRDARNVLAAVVARDGGVQLGVVAAYADGQAVMLAQDGNRIYALRAFPPGL